MKLLRSYLVGNVKRMNDNNVRMEYIGRICELPSEVQETMQWATEATAKNTGTTLTLALNYGSRSEIVDATRAILADLVAEAHQRGCSLEDLLQVDGIEARLDEHHITNALYTAHMPDPDLVIRTSGEQRISNFLLWQIAYSEIFITDRLWPDFRGIHLLEAIQSYQRRERRFGGLGESLTDEDLDALEPAADVAVEIATTLTPKQPAIR
jgi:undecaprenyl diphosphate synthase